MKKSEKTKTPERIAIVTIRSEAEKEAVSFATWRYWEIVGELVCRHADRQEAYDAARWCARFAKPGDKRELTPGIELEVR